MELLSAFFLWLVPPNYFYKAGSIEVSFATRSQAQDSPLERARQTGWIWKTSSSSRLDTALYRIDFTNLIRSNKLKINFNDDYVSKIAPWVSCLVTLQLLQIFKGSTEFPLNQSEDKLKLIEFLKQRRWSRQTVYLSYWANHRKQLIHVTHSC